MKREDDTEILIQQIRVSVSDISGFLAELRRIGKKHHCTLICFNREVIAGQRHSRSAIRHAERAFEEGQTIARSLEVESLLYAAGTRQTGLIGPFGIHMGMNECYLCIVPGRPDVYEELLGMMEDAGDEDWELINPEKERRLCQFFEITAPELAITGKERLQDLVLERVALLTVHR